MVQTLSLMSALNYDHVEMVPAKHASRSFQQSRAQICSIGALLQHLLQVIAFAVCACAIVSDVLLFAESHHQPDRGRRPDGHHEHPAYSLVRML